MEKSLSVFSFEGFILEYPVQREKVDDWIESQDCLNYPNIPDLPGPTYWDEFAVSELKSCIESNHDVIVISEVQQNKVNKKRINFLLKTIGIFPDDIILKEKNQKIEKFYKSNIGYQIQCVNNTNKNYENINLYLNDFELTSNVADYITSNFGLNTFLHAV